MESKKEEKTEEYKKYEAARDALSKLMDEHGQDVTLQAMTDCLANAVGIDAMSMLVESIKETKKHDEFFPTHLNPIDREKAKKGEFRKQLIDKYIDGEVRRNQLIDKQLAVRKQLIIKHMDSEFRKQLYNFV